MDAKRLYEIEIAVRRGVLYESHSRDLIEAYRDLREEAVELATVMERLARYTKQWHPDMKSDEPCVVYEAWDKAQELLSRRSIVELLNVPPAAPSSSENDSVEAARRSKSSD